MIGASRRYDGPLGKSDRPFVFGALGLWVRTRRGAARLDGGDPAIPGCCSPSRWRTGSARGLTEAGAVVIERAAAGFITFLAARSPRSEASGAASADLAPRIFRQPYQQRRLPVDLDRAARRRCARTRPVAAADYWPEGPPAALRRGPRVPRRADRARGRQPDATRSADGRRPRRGASLIVFPEGAQSDRRGAAANAKSGLYHLARLRPGIALVPVWIENLTRVMPKGSETDPLPLICTVAFGPPMALRRGTSATAAFRSGRGRRFWPSGGDARRHDARPGRRCSLFAVGAVLLVATAVGRAAWMAQPGRAPDPVIDNLNQRIKARWVMVILIGTAPPVRPAGRRSRSSLRLVHRVAQFITLTARGAATMSCCSPPNCAW